MLVTLSKLADKDFRPYFDMYGLYYSDLAASQIEQAGYLSKVNMGMYMIETELPNLSISTELPYLPLSLSDKTTKWRDGSSPSDCL